MTQLRHQVHVVCYYRDPVCGTILFQVYSKGSFSAGMDRKNELSEKILTKKVT